MYGSKPLYGSCRKDIIKCPVKDIALSFAYYMNEHCKGRAFY